MHRGDEALLQRTTPANGILDGQQTYLPASQSASQRVACAAMTYVQFLHEVSCKRVWRHTA